MGSRTPSREKPYATSWKNRYLFRSPVSYRQLVYDEKTGKVKCRSKRGGYREWPHAVDFLATLAQHVPRPRQHVVTYAGHYANATGNLKPAPEEENEEPGEARPGATPTTKGKKWSWAKLIARVWQVDPLICDCGAQMKRGRKLKDEELRQFLLSVNKLGYPPRPPPAPLPDLEGASHPPGDDFVESTELNFSDSLNQVPPGWDDL